MESLVSARLNLLTGTVPIDDVHQLPGISAEFELKLPLFVDDQLGSRVKNTGALVLVRIVQVKFAGSQIEGSAWAGVIGFGESDRSIGGEPNLAACRRRNQGNISEVGANRAGDGNAANRLHVFEGFD